MALIRWQPLQEIEALQHEINRLFDGLAPNRMGPLGSSRFFPAAELNETDDALDLKVEIPGMAPEDIDLEVSVDSVSISGERRSETKTDKDGVVRSEFHYGRFQRVIPLPARVHNTEVDAQYKDGILTLHMPKVESEQNRVVKVNLN